MIELARTLHHFLTKTDWDLSPNFRVTMRENLTQLCLGSTNLGLTVKEKVLRKAGVGFVESP